MNKKVFYLVFVLFALVFGMLPAQTTYVWEYDSFDALPINQHLCDYEPLWRPSWSGSGIPHIVWTYPIQTTPNQLLGNCIDLKPHPNTAGAVVAVQKNLITPLYSGIQILQFRVFVGNNPIFNGFLAKIQVTCPYVASGALFEILFAQSGFRLADGNTGTRIDYANANWSGRWHNVRCEINIDTSRVRVFIDNVANPYEIQFPAGTAFTYTPGPIYGIALTGWDYRPAKVYIDNIIGFN